jgi:hypothetical protein
VIDSCIIATQVDTEGNPSSAGPQAKYQKWGNQKEGMGTHHQKAISKLGDIIACGEENLESLSCIYRPFTVSAQQECMCSE